MKIASLTFGALGVAACTFFGACVSPPKSPKQVDSSPFVHVREMAFVDRGEAYVPFGANVWYLAHLASIRVQNGRARVASELDALSAEGENTLRIFASSEGEQAPGRVYPTMQPNPGIYDEDLLDGLDFVLSEMRKRGMKAILCLTNFWSWSGGMPQYVAWATQSPIPDTERDGWDALSRYSKTFYELPAAKKLYFQFVQQLVMRQNKYTQQNYRDDQTIFAWEIANEPRGGHDFLIEAATFIKSLDSSHMVTTGSEGSTGNPSYAGLDFVADHADSHIDFATVHLWPQNWRWYDPKEESSFEPAMQRSMDYLREHESLAKTRLHKPMLLEEFGLARDGGSFERSATTRHRDLFFNSLLTELRGAGFGALVWAWSGRGEAPFFGDPPHEPTGWYGVYASDESTLATLRKFVAK